MVNRGAFNIAGPHGPAPHTPRDETTPTAAGMPDLPGRNGTGVGYPPAHVGRGGGEPALDPLLHPGVLDDGKEDERQRLANLLVPDDATRAALMAASAARVAAAAAAALSEAVRRDVLAAAREARKDAHWLATLATLLATVALIIVVAVAHGFVGRLSQSIDHEALTSMARLAPLKICADAKQEAAGAVCRSVFAVCGNTSQMDALLSPPPAGGGGRAGAVPGPLASRGLQLHPVSSVASYVSDDWDMSTLLSFESVASVLLECRAFQAWYTAYNLQEFISGVRQVLTEDVDYTNGTAAYAHNLYGALQKQLSVGQVTSQLFVDGVDAGDLNLLRVAMSVGALSQDQATLLASLPGAGFTWRADGNDGFSAVWVRVNQTRETAACLAQPRMRLLATAVRDHVATAPAPSLSGDATSGAGGAGWAAGVTQAGTASIGGPNRSRAASGSGELCTAEGTALYILPSMCHSYSCRGRVDVQFWGDWANFLAVTRTSFPSQFLGMNGTYDDMYATYTGAIGAMLGAAGVFVASLLMSGAKSLLVPLHRARAWWRGRKQPRGPVLDHVVEKKEDVNDGGSGENTVTSVTKQSWDG